MIRRTCQTRPTRPTCPTLPPQKNSLTCWLVDLLTQNATEKAAPRVVWARVLVVDWDW